MSLLVICPTRERPEKFREFLKSFKDTAKDADLCLVIDHDDPKFNEYCPSSEFIVNYKHKNTTQIFNSVFEAFPDYDFYSCSNDDFVYRTKGWDRALCRKGKICYGNDLLAGKDMPTTSVIDGDIVRALGWLQMPKLQFTQGDAVWKALGHRLNILKHYPKVVIEHRHWSISGEPDETSKRTNNTRTVREDAKAFREWLHKDMETDVSKLTRRLALL